MNSIPGICYQAFLPPFFSFFLSFLPFFSKTAFFSFCYSILCLNFWILGFQVYTIMSACNQSWFVCHLVLFGQNLILEIRLASSLLQSCDLRLFGSSGNIDGNPDNWEIWSLKWHNAFPRKCMLVWILN